jgi:G protein-coupled receptor 157
MNSGKALEICALLVTPLLYFLIVCDTRGRSSIRHALITSEARAAVYDTDRKLAFVPFIFVFLRIWGTLRFLINVNSNENTPIFFLELLQVC